MTDQLLVALVGALIALLLLRALQRWAGSRKAHRRAARATAGENGAVAMLEAAGYAIVARQARISWSPTVDGEPRATEVRADYLVELEGERLVAEVKTGSEAPELSTAATRRQLLEYRVAFAVEGVLLVCPERGTIQRVEFPLPTRSVDPRIG